MVRTVQPQKSILTDLGDVPSSSDVAQRRAFVVLGMHRSGTSAMTRTLSLLGAALPKQLMTAASDNEAGFWESQAIADLNDEILQAQDSDWDDVFSFREHRYLSNFDRYYVGRAVELIDEQFNGSEVIVIKDPRISVLTAFWNRVLKEAGYTIHYIVMVRNPLEVAESLRTRNGFPREKSFLLWCSYMIALDRDTRQQVRTFVSYDQLMQDWRSVRGRIQATTGTPFPRDTAAAAIEIDRHLNRSLRHHSAASEDLLARADVPESLKETYRIFASACEGGAVDEAALREIERGLSQIESLVGPVIADLRLSTKEMIRRIAELEEASSQSNARATSLDDELTSERAQHQQTLAELEGRSAALIAQLTEEHAQIVAELETRLNELLKELETEQSQHHRSLAESKAQAEQLRSQLEEQRQLNTSILEQLRTREIELAGKEAESDSLMSKLTSAQENAEAKIEALLSSVRTAQTANIALEKRLAAHFHESATLSRMLLESEEQAKIRSEKTSLVTRFYDAVASQPRWWSMLPRSTRLKLQRARMRRLRIFDADSYLEKNPDVAAAGEDPIHHFLHHGIHEQRQV